MGFVPRRLVLRFLVLIGLLASGLGAQTWNRIGTLQVGPGSPRAPRFSIEDLEEGRQLVTVRFHSYGIWEYRHLRKMYTVYNFPGCGFEGEPGEPWTPIWSKLLELGHGETVLFEGAEFDWSGKEVHGRWFPAQQPRPETEALEVLVTNEETYQREGDVFQGVRVGLDTSPRIWNNRWLHLSLRPFRYFPREGRTSFLREARIFLRRLNRPPEEAPEVEHVVKRHAGYMVITPERFREGLKPFLRFKRKAHPDLEVRTLEEIGSTVEDIDRVIERAGSRGTENFLLVGHSTVLPSAPYKSLWSQEDDPPDCFDDDSVYRNRGDDGYPSYKVGRFPVVSDSELETVVAKTLRRWKSPGVYQTRPMLIAHEEQAPGKYQGCVSDILRTIGPHSKVTWKPRMILPASPRRGGLGSRVEDFYSAMQSGVGLMLYRGHGGTKYLATRYLDYWGKKQKHWYEMKAAVPPVFYSVACLNGQMTDGEGERAYGLCENLLTSRTHGVSGTIGAIQPSPTTPNHTFAWNLMHYTYQNPQRTLGEIFQRSLKETMKYGISRNRWSHVWRSMGRLYNLYGDPELPVTNLHRRRAGRPQ